MGLKFTTHYLFVHQNLYYSLAKTLVNLSGNIKVFAAMHVPFVSIKFKKNLIIDYGMLSFRKYDFSHHHTSLGFVAAAPWSTFLPAGPGATLLGDGSPAAARRSRSFLTAAKRSPIIGDNRALAMRPST